MEVNQLRWIEKERKKQTNKILIHLNTLVQIID